MPPPCPTKRHKSAPLRHVCPPSLKIAILVANRAKILSFFCGIPQTTRNTGICRSKKMADRWAMRRATWRPPSLPCDVEPHVQWLPSTRRSYNCAATV